MRLFLSNFTSHYVQITLYIYECQQKNKHLYIPLRSDNSPFINLPTFYFTRFTSHYVQITPVWREWKGIAEKNFTSHYVQITPWNFVWYVRRYALYIPLRSDNSRSFSFNPFATAPFTSHYVQITRSRTLPIAFMISALYIPLRSDNSVSI